MIWIGNLYSRIRIIVIREVISDRAGCYSIKGYLLRQLVGWSYGVECRIKVDLLVEALWTVYRDRCVKCVMNEIFGV